MNNTTTITALLFTLAAASVHAETPVAVEDKAESSLLHQVARPHHTRMALELAALFTVGNRWYWRNNGKSNEVDWQLPHGAPAIEAKLGGTGGWRFDGNPYDINALGHPGFGMLTHFMARENGYGIGESFLISSLASGTWEVFLEWREYGSLNDIGMTSTAGVSLGETAFQMIHHLRESHFELRGGLGTENGAAFATVAARGELDLIPTRGEGTFRGGRHVSFAAEMPTDELGVRSYEGGAKSTLAGYYQNTGDSRLVAGVSTEFDYRKDNERKDRDWDLLTSVAAGPSIDYQVRDDSGITLGVGADLYANFGMLKSQGFANWRAAHPMDRIRNVMENRAHPYYYAMGASLDPRINVGYEGYFASAKVSGAMFSSLDSADRDQEMLTTKVHFSDRDENAELAAGYAQDNWSVMLDARLRNREGHAGGAEDSTARHTAMLTIGVRR